MSLEQCTACERPLEQVSNEYDNILLIGFHGGYGWFVDNLAATLPNNTADRWLRDEDGEYLTINNDGRTPVPNEAWEPTYNEERTLNPPPDYEAVICHECAHALCAQVPWLAKLLNPHGSHAHRTAWKEAHPDHWGWDYDIRD